MSQGVGNIWGRVEMEQDYPIRGICLTYGQIIWIN